MRITRNARSFCALVVFSLWLHGAVGACASHVPEYAFVDGGEGGAEEAAIEASEAAEEGGSDTGPAPPAAMTHLRFAVWSPDTPEADFCVAPLAPAADAGDAAPMDDGGDEDVGAGSGSDAGQPIWQGPLVAQAATEVDGGIGVFADADTPGVTFPQVTRYFELPAGAYLVRAVAAGAADCTLPLLPSSDATLPTLKPNAFTTTAIVGDYAQASKDAMVTVVTLPDDSSAASGSVALRFVATLPSVGFLDLGTGTLGSPGWKPLFTDVGFGLAGAQADSDAGKVDHDGYLSIPPLADTILTATVAMVSDAGAPIIVTRGVSIGSGAVATLVAIGGKTGDLTPPQLLLCLDKAPPVGVVFADCNVLLSAGD
jgi:hypothetical protein